MFYDVIFFFFLNNVWVLVVLFYLRERKGNEVIARMVEYLSAYSKIAVHIISCNSPWQLNEKNFDSILKSMKNSKKKRNPDAKENFF